MVDVLKLRSRMALLGYNQKSLVEELNNNGIKISENTLSAKMNGKPFDTDLVDGICDILQIEDPAEKAKIFLVSSSQIRDSEGGLA